jgi:hypothetical protein
MQLANSDNAPSLTCQLLCYKYLIEWYANVLAFYIEIMYEQHFNTAYLIMTLLSANFSTSDVIN